ncbi:MAG: hypothetical protein LBS56_00645 [Propionibacteriaceae bacterium]|jgi:hypothetical protein|nr:hypothetical protein [Propionibacteriaceae bacterium]
MGGAAVRIGVGGRIGALVGGILAAFGLVLIAAGGGRVGMGAVSGVIMLSIGLLFAVVGGGGVMSAVARWRRLKRAQETGEVVYAAITGVHQDTTTSVNGQHPYYLELAWTDPASGRVATFRSESTMEDPSYALARTGVWELPVHVTVDPPAHYVDDSILRQGPSELR